MIQAEALVALLVLHQGIGEPLYVAGRLPDARVHEDAGVDPLNVVAVGHLSPPRLLDIAQELDPQRPIVPAAIEATVDLRALKDEPLALAQGDDFFHHFGLSLSLCHTLHLQLVGP